MTVENFKVILQIVSALLLPTLHALSFLHVSRYVYHHFTAMFHLMNMFDVLKKLAIILNTQSFASTLI
ncbi:hypothetical protein [Heyndrickxia oleronia]|uniref:hypothetical protein n=1 Tax=Heyndrickxia oleronia TaxID=38875 RepID=UPI001C0EEB73|nr:hypothetical protein [Heyndrickxia oleronia]MBU5210086.1 hypothetical protein [Heyndrickxia oleronia]